MNESAAGGEKPRIIIDEDWKSQVQAEKEALSKQKESAAVRQGTGPEVQKPPEASHSHGPLPPPTLPPATLPVLITTLATQALAMLGQIPLPGSDKPEVHLDEAKHFIDLLEMLEQKTAGNRTPEESQLLDNVLHELRMSFVTLKK
ncbi:MAG TPA: DUF1844 domain-containing protein [Pirellulales bacterium]|nr:DUF1844 domain-containing protein [Pirellulales bacterium]